MVPMVALSGKSLGRLPSEDYYEEDDVPVFTVHTAPPATEGGQPFVVDEARLRALCDNCNRRIEQGGNYVPIVVGHTSDPSDSHQREPEMIGFASDFKMGKHAGRPAIFAKFHIFKSEAQVRRRHPRVSVELWANGSPDRWYFDPISVLGATTPALDLGMRFQKSKRGKKPLRVIRYEMASAGAEPGATNVSPPSSTPRKHDMATDTTTPAAGDQADDVVDRLMRAMEKAPWVQWVMRKMQAEGGIDAQPEPIADAAGGAVDAPPAEPVAAPETSDVDVVDVDGDGDEDVVLESQEADSEDYSKLKQYVADDRKDFGLGFLEGVDDERRAKLHACMSPEVKKYFNLAEEVATADAAMPASQPQGVSVPTQTNDKPDQFSKGEGARKYAMLEAELTKLKRQVAEHEKANIELQKDKTRQLRYSKLTDLKSDGYALDVAEEMELVSELDDAGFDRHCNIIQRKYARDPSRIGSFPVPAGNGKRVKAEDINAWVSLNIKNPEYAGKSSDQMKAIAAQRLGG